MVSVAYRTWWFFIGDDFSASNAVTFFCGVLSGEGVSGDEDSSAEGGGSAGGEEGEGGGGEEGEERGERGGRGAASSDDNDLVSGEEAAGQVAVHWREVRGSAGRAREVMANVSSSLFDSVVSRFVTDSNGW